RKLPPGRPARLRSSRYVGDDSVNMRHAGLLALLLAATASAQLGPSPQEPDVLRYVARVEPNIATKSVRGTVTVRIDTSAALPAPFSFDAGDLVVDSVREAGRDVPFVKLDRRLIVPLPAPRK